LHETFELVLLPLVLSGRVKKIDGESLQSVIYQHASLTIQNPCIPWWLAGLVGSVDDEGFGARRRKVSVCTSRIKVLFG